MGKRSHTKYSTTIVSPIRYPGGKSRLKVRILPYLYERYNADSLYVEPFVGGASVALDFLQNTNCRAIINDLDMGISSLWIAITNSPEEFCDKVIKFRPSVEAFYNAKDYLMSNPSGPPLEIGFAKLVVHQLSYSGLGIRSGGPLGGVNQESAYKIGCRWSVKNIVKQVKGISRLFSNRLEYPCTHLDFEEVIRSNDKALLYLDPPYYVKGDSLYKHSMSEDDHIRLRNTLDDIPNQFILSYDDCPEVRKLYNGYKIFPLMTNYSISTSRHKIELLIMRP